MLLQRGNSYIHYEIVYSLLDPNEAGINFIHNIGYRFELLVILGHWTHLNNKITRGFGSWFTFSPEFIYCALFVLTSIISLTWMLD